MAAATRPAFRHLRVGDPQVSSAPKCAGSREAMMNPGQLNALAGGADSGGYVSVGGIPLAPLLVWAPQRRFGHEKGHGVLDVASGQDTKSHHQTTMGIPRRRRTRLSSVRSLEAAKHDGRKSMPKYEFMCESCKKSFEVVLTAAERAAGKIACPTVAAEKSRPGWPSLARKP